MEITDYRKGIQKPISEQNKVGERLIDDPLFDYIEEQMMKVGSLSHAKVQWDEVEHSIIMLLSEKTKDIKLLTHLLQCLHYRLTPKRLIVSFGVMSDFMSHYWQSAYPAPGKRGNLPRRKFFSQMAQRFSNTLEKVDFGQFDSQDREELTNVVKEWSDTLEEQSLNTEMAQSIARKAQQELRKVEERKLAETKQPVPASTPEIRNEVTLDTSSSKATKQSLLQVADYVSEEESGMALAIRLRRFAVWGSIDSLPDHSSSGETQLKGMQQDRVKDYKDRLRHPDLVLWRQVEQSLTMAPYWFEGHFLSYQIAKSLGHASWCEAIIEELKQFLERMPELTKLRFRGGEPFVSQEVSTWINDDSGSSNSTSDSVSLGSWDEIRKETLSLSKEAGVAVALSMLNDGLERAKEPRDQYYWRLLSADLLQSSQLTEMAKAQYQTLYEQVLTMKVTDWEPSLIKVLEQITSE